MHLGQGPGRKACGSGRGLARKQWVQEWHRQGQVGSKGLSGLGSMSRLGALTGDQEMLETSELTGVAAFTSFDEYLE